MDSDDTFDVKIVDFGLSTIVQTGKVDLQKCGSPGYVGYS